MERQRPKIEFGGGAIEVQMQGRLRGNEGEPLTFFPNTGERADVRIGVEIGVKTVKARSLVNWTIANRVNVMRLRFLNIKKQSHSNEEEKDLGLGTLSAELIDQCSTLVE